ncbi:MAG: GntR family transcriptional regulator [Eubacterium sp.]|uniref:GntR family transcriptional regulator n=1 Tax=Bilifractor sp. LCP21S3_A7 TaxID=3438738 RepID=UPI003F8EEF3A|nr:GntR family transcriptional regulator [Eubacterium sp.]
MAWEFKNGIPIYLQIMEGIKTRIAGGLLPPGSKLPSVRDLAAQAGVNPNTMQRAMTQLEQEGLLYTQRTSGRFVTEDEAKMKELRSSLSEKYVEELFTQLSRLGMSREEIISEVSRWRPQEDENVNKSSE